MKIDDLLESYDYMTWADAKVWGTVFACDQALQDDKLRGMLCHLHIVQRFFLRAWRNEPLDAPFPQFEQTPALYEWAKTYYEEARTFLNMLTYEQLNGPMPVAWMQRMEHVLGPPPPITTLGETATQVLLHSTYHRGQINTRLRELGATPPLVDYVAWVWYRRPAAVWMLNEMQ